MKKIGVLLLGILLIPFVTADLAERLEQHVFILSEKIGERSVRTPENLEKAAEYITEEFEKIGYQVEVQPYNARGDIYKNIQAIKPGNCDSIVIGAHYDTVRGSRGADDDASGIAVLLELARALKNKSTSNTIRFVAFSTEEPPFFKSYYMGSLVYAKRLKLEGVRVKGVIALDMLGYYSEREGSQKYPFWYGYGRSKAGNFIATISNRKSREWNDQITNLLRQNTNLPIESAWLYDFVPGVDWSDHWAFWQEGYKAMLITDTGPYRNPSYHRKSDRYSTLDYNKMAELTNGLVQTLAE